MRPLSLVLDGAPISEERAGSRLGYRLDQTHTALIVWTPEHDADLRGVDDVVETLAKRGALVP